MKTFEILISRPVKVEVQAETFEDAIEIIRQQYHIIDTEPITFTEIIDTPSPPQVKS